jgi:hypothetical protein
LQLFVEEGKKSGFLGLLSLERKKKQEEDIKQPENLLLERLGFNFAESKVASQKTRTSLFLSLYLPSLKDILIGDPEYTSLQLIYKSPFVRPVWTPADKGSQAG